MRQENEYFSMFRCVDDATVSSTPSPTTAAPTTTAATTTTMPTQSMWTHLAESMPPTYDSIISGSLTGPV